jgi:hypothetical protein
MHQNFQELLFAFNAGQVRYLIVGRYAVSFHAQPRAKISAGRRLDLIDVDSSREGD